MRATGVMRFVVFGAVRFGIGGAIYGPSSFLLPGIVAVLLALLAGGAVGGASLGLSLKDFRQVLILAVLGALGLTVGVFAGLIIGSSFFNYSEVAIGAIVGAVVGASLGVPFLDWRTIVALVVAGAVGFGVGVPVGDDLPASFPILRGPAGAESYAIAGLIGGASLGAALGYLEHRKLAAEREPRVR